MKTNVSVQRFLFISLFSQDGHASAEPTTGSLTVSTSRIMLVPPRRFSRILISRLIFFFLTGWFHGEIKQSRQRQKTKERSGGYNKRIYQVQTCKGSNPFSNSDLEPADPAWPAAAIRQHWPVNLWPSEHKWGWGSRQQASSFVSRLWKH